MTEGQKTFLRTMAHRADEIMERAKAACDLCHLPYVMQEQDARDEACEACPVGKLLQELKAKAYGSGAVAGLVEASIMVANAAERACGNEEVVQDAE